MLSLEGFRYNIPTDAIEIMKADVRNGHVLRFFSTNRNDFNPTEALSMLKAGEQFFTRIYGTPVFLNSNFFRDNRYEMSDLSQYVLDRIPLI
jgi:hypothetical protein